MAHPFDLDELVDRLKEAASGVLEEDVTTISGFSRQQLAAMAKQAAWIAEAAAKRELEGDLLEFFLKNLQDLARNFAQALRGLVALTVERVWNALVGVLWDAIERVAGFSMPRIG